MKSMSKKILNAAMPIGNVSIDATIIRTNSLSLPISMPSTPLIPGTSRQMAASFRTAGPGEPMPRAGPRYATPVDPLRTYDYLIKSRERVMGA